MSLDPATLPKTFDEAIFRLCEQFGFFAPSIKNSWTLATIAHNWAMGSIHPATISSAIAAAQSQPLPWKAFIDQFDEACSYVANQSIVNHDTINASGIAMGTLAAAPGGGVTFQGRRPANEAASAYWGHGSRN